VRGEEDGEESSRQTNQKLTSMPKTPSPPPLLPSLSPLLSVLALPPSCCGRRREEGREGEVDVHGGLGTDQVGEGFLLCDGMKMEKMRHWKAIRSHPLSLALPPAPHSFTSPVLTYKNKASSIQSLPPAPPSLPPSPPLHHPRRHKTNDTVGPHPPAGPNSWHLERQRRKEQKRRRQKAPRAVPSFDCCCCLCC